MNITGSSNYSRETVGLRQPGQIQNQQFKLIYAYPLLFSDTIGQDLQTVCRKFQTVSFLKEIIVSNSLNIIKSASQVPGPGNNQNNVAQLIGNAILTGSGGSSSSGSFQPTSISPMAYDIQSRVEEKTNQIKKYLYNDVRTKKLLPYVEIITLNNLVDVPVIVGTKGFGVMTNTLLYILSVAIAAQISMDRLENVNTIVQKLKNTKEEDWFKILTSLTKDNKTFRERTVERFRSAFPEFRNTLQLNRLTAYLLRKFEGETTGEQEKRDLAAKQPDVKVELNSIFNLLKLTKNNLDNTLLNFKFVLDPIMLKNQIGLDTSNNTMETTVTKLSSNQKQIFMQMHDRFMELVSTPGSLFLTSVFNTLYPTPFDYDRSDPQNIDTRGNLDINFLELKDKHFDRGLNSKLKNLINDTFSKEITNSLSSNKPSEAQERVSLVKSLCMSLSNVDKMLETEVNRFLGNSYVDSIVKSTNFNDIDIEKFSDVMNRMSANFGSQNRRFENIFSQLVNNSKSILALARTSIYSSIEDFMRDIYDRPYYQSMLSYKLGVDSDTVKRVYIPQMTDVLFVIFYFFFLYRLQAAICQYMDIIDIEIESKVNDVFDFPNYTLVIPIDILQGVHAAYVANNFNKLLSGSDVSPVSSLNDNYTRGMIKFLCKRIKIPSIMVVDDRKKELHYQFMYMTAPEKISFSSLDAFINAGVN